MIVRNKILILILFFQFVSEIGMSQHLPTTITIKAIPGLQFDLPRFTVKPGARVRIVFANADDMSHNFLITKPKARLDVVNEALQLEEKGPAMDYIPKSSKVLWYIPVISPKETKSIEFTAPTTAGVYPYVCTYPGHGFLMYGAMYVNSDGKMPPLKEDENLPPGSREEASKAAADPHVAHDKEAAKTPANHPYNPVAPYLYRIFMEDASPAAIAVNLPQDISYCWDAGSCKLLYAWYGGFLDNTTIWKGHRDATGKVLGTVFFRDKSEYPLRIGRAEKVPVVEYKGYRLINRFPEFHYTINGLDVYELIEPTADGNGLLRTFRIPKADDTVWFVPNSNEPIRYESSSGKWVDEKLKFSKQEAQEFKVSMSNFSLIYNTKRKKK